MLIELLPGIHSGIGSEVPQAFYNASATHIIAISGFKLLLIDALLWRQYLPQTLTRADLKFSPTIILTLHQCALLSLYGISIFLISHFSQSTKRSPCVTLVCKMEAMEGKRPNQELLRFLKSVRDRAADQGNVLFGPMIAIPPAIFLAYFGTDMDLGLAILLSIVIAIGSWLLLVLILSLAKQRPTISKAHAALALALMLLVFFGNSAFNKDRVIQNLGAANTAQSEALTSQAESLRYA